MDFGILSWYMVALDLKWFTGLEVLSPFQTDSWFLRYSRNKILVSVSLQDLWAFYSFIISSCTLASSSSFSACFLAFFKISLDLLCYFVFLNVFFAIASPSSSTCIEGSDFRSRKSILAMTSSLRRLFRVFTTWKRVLCWISTFDLRWQESLWILNGREDQSIELSFVWLNICHCSKTIVRWIEGGGHRTDSDSSTVSDWSRLDLSEYELVNHTYHCKIVDKKSL